MTDRALLPIGRFARACRLSVKALRHYDELGLLRPARVDASGYRQYARSQARTAIAISLLRSLDLPLAAIKDVLAASDPEQVAARLATERARIERDLARSRQALSCVERIMRDGALMPYEMAIRDEPERHLLYVQDTTRPELHVEAGFALFERLERVLAELELPLSQPLMCLLPDPPDDDTMVLQMCAIVPGSLARSRAEAAGARLITLDAGRLAFATHRGPYEELGIAQHAVMAWVHERGHEPAGPLREIYVDDPARVPAAELRTEIGVAIAG